jgi:phosphatidylinositol alpha-1,6-mannosyltransferase
MSDHKTRVAFVFIDIFSQEGGIQSYVRDIIKAYLNDKNTPPADIYLLRDRSANLNPFSTHPKLKFYYFGSSNVNVGRLRLTTALIKKLLDKQYSRVVCGHIFLARLLGPLCQVFGVPFTIMTYGKEVWSAVPTLQRQALQRAEEIWAISRYSRDFACSANNLDPTKFQMLPCIVDGETFSPGSKRTELVQKYGLENCRVLMTVARLWSGDIYKGVDVTIRALPQILQSFPDVKYLVVGRGDDQPRLAKLAKDLNIQDQVVFAGFVPTEELVDHYRLADAYVMPSKEGFGIVYLEAMACGVPTVSGDDDGSADPLQDGRLGWRVPYRDPVAVAHACIEILQGEDPRCDGQWLREETLRYFSPQSLQASLGKLFTASYS